MKKKIIIFASIVAVILAFFLIRYILINQTIAKIANEKGEKYGVTDFTSKSASFNGEVWTIQLYSNKFDSLSNEDKFNLMISIGADKKMISMLAKEIQDCENPLAYARFNIYSGNKKHYQVAMDEDKDYIYVHTLGPKGVSFGANGIEEYGYKVQFRNKYGNINTKCAHVGCTNSIARTGDTNCCVKHSNRCGECNCYIDEDAMFCMSCIKSAIG